MTHLMAQKFAYNESDIFWRVRLSESVDRQYLTHLSSDASDCEGSAEIIAGRIEEFWDEDWTMAPSDPTYPQSEPWQSQGI